MDKIAIFGGSFDPVHIAHTDIAIEVLKMPDVKKVIFVPAHTPPHKVKQFADMEHRIAMLNLAVKNIQRTEISFFEIERQDIVYSYQTLDYFRNLYPDYEIMMIIGSDSLKALDLWNNVGYLTENYRFLVAKRPDVFIDESVKYLNRCIFLDVIMKKVSSTYIRELIEDNDMDAKKFLSLNVYEYIREYGLYK